MSKKVSLNGRLVGEGEPVYIIAEGGLTNWGQIDLAKKQADAALAARCDAVKYQAQTTEALVSKVVSPYWYDRLKYKELPHEELKQLMAYCKEIGIQGFITAHTDVDLEFLDKQLNVPFHKVGSGESLNLEFLEHVGACKKPVIMSLGLHTSLDEARESVAALERGGTRDIILMHCNTIYPTPWEIIDLSIIGKLKEVFEYPIGYSDHTEGWHIPLAAVALGATIIEKHLSFDLADERSLDSAVSCTPETLITMVRQMRQVDAARIDRSGARPQAILKGREWARQSIVAAHAIPKGTTITRDMLALKRPGTGLGPERVQDILGKKAARDLGEDELVLEVDVT